MDAKSRRWEAAQEKPTTIAAPRCAGTDPSDRMTRTDRLTLKEMDGLARLGQGSNRVDNSAFSPRRQAFERHHHGGRP